MQKSEIMQQIEKFPPSRDPQTNSFREQMVASTRIVMAFPDGWSLRWELLMNAWTEKEGAQ